MTAQGWIGFGFVALLVLFFMIAFFMKHLTPDQMKIFRLLASLCAGFAGGLLAGEALFQLSVQPTQGTNVLARGTGGFGLFMIVWYGFGQAVHATPPAPDQFNFSVPSGWTFGSTAQAIAKQDNAIAKFEGFSENELQAILQARELHTDTPKAAMLALRDLTVSSAVRRYEVTLAAPTYTLRVI